jgi:uncharacterized integral membrane protein
MADEPARRERHDTSRLIGGLVVLVVLLAFVIDNTRRVTVGFVFTDHRTRLIYVLIVTALIGVVLDRLWLRSRRHR